MQNEMVQAEKNGIAQDFFVPWKIVQTLHQNMEISKRQWKNEISNIMRWTLFRKLLPTTLLYIFFGGCFLDFFPRPLLSFRIPFEYCLIKSKTKEKNGWKKWGKKLFKWCCNTFLFWMADWKMKIGIFMVLLNWMHILCNWTTFSMQSFSSDSSKF